MPIPYEVTLYGCQFKCGHRHVSNRKFMEAHEERCWRNLVNRTCKTCRHEGYLSDSAGDVFGDGRFIEPLWYERSCKSGDGEHLIDAIYDALSERHVDNPNMYGVQIPPVTDCPYWEPMPIDKLPK